MSSVMVSKWNSVFLQGFMLIKKNNVGYYDDSQVQNGNYISVFQPHTDTVHTPLGLNMLKEEDEKQ